MTDIDDITDPVDGRVARRTRNIDAVLDVVLELFGEEAMFPTIEQAATRSGLSLRSLYRYFADPGELLEAAIKRSRERAEEIGRLHAIGEGSFALRLDEFVDLRLRVHESFGSVYRATVANAARHQRIRDEMTHNRAVMRDQFEQQFAPELTALKSADRTAALAAGDLLTQIGSIEFLRSERDLSVAETKSVLISALRSLLVS